MRSRREIREALSAELAGAAPDSGRVEELTAELEAARRVWRRRRRDTATRARTAVRLEREPDPTPPGGWPADQVARLPAELRARLNRSAFNRVIDRASSVNDPDNWGAKNDLRRR